MPNPDRPTPQLRPPRRRIISLRALVRRAGRQDGQTLVFSAVVLTMMLGLAALTIDLGSMYVAQRHAQTASDAGALAAAEDLPLPSQLATATTDATNYAHTLNDPAATPATTTIPVGTSCTSPSYISTNPSSFAACFQAKVGVSETVPYSFARLFGLNSGTVSATSVASPNLTPDPNGTFNNGAVCNSGSPCVPNGTFPTGCSTTQPDPTFCEPGVGSTIGTSGTPWTVIFGNVDWAQDGAKYVNYVEAPGYSGANVIDMNGNEDGGIQQTVTNLVAGQKYLLSFLMSGNAGYSEPSFTMTVAIGNPLTVAAAPPPATPTVTCPSQTFCIPVTQIDNPPNEMSWEQVGIPFTASSTSTTITFVSTSSQANVQYDNTGPALAEVNVQRAEYGLTQ